MIKMNNLKSIFLTGSTGALAAIFALFMLHVPMTEGAVVNGGFEDNVTLQTPPAVSFAPLTGWTRQTDAQNDVIGRDTSTLYALPPHTGNIAAAYYSGTNAGGNGASLTQTLTTDVTKTYNLTLWVANSIADTSNLNNVFSVGWGGNLAGNLIALSAPGARLIPLGGNLYQVQGDPNPITSWFQVTATGLTPAGATTDLFINARSNDWAILVDDVTVDVVPEPATVAMLGVGAVLMGFRRRRQQRS